MFVQSTPLSHVKMELILMMMMVMTKTMMTWLMMKSPTAMTVMTRMMMRLMMMTSMTMKRWHCGRLKGENCVKTQSRSDPFLLLDHTHTNEIQMQTYTHKSIYSLQLSTDPDRVDQTKN